MSKEQGISSPPTSRTAHSSSRWAALPGDPHPRMLHPHSTSRCAQPAAQESIIGEATRESRACWGPSHKKRADDTKPLWGKVPCTSSKPPLPQLRLQTPQPWLPALRSPPAWRKSPILQALMDTSDQMGPTAPQDLSNSDHKPHTNSSTSGHPSSGASHEHGTLPAHSNAGMEPGAPRVNTTHPHPSLFLYRNPDFSVPYCLFPWCWWML